MASRRGGRAAGAELAHQHPAGSAEHVHALWVARFARRRLDELNGSDLASKYELGGEWRARRGSLIDADWSIEDILATR